MLKEHRLRVLEEENRALNNTLQTFLDDYNSLRASLGLSVSIIYIYTAIHSPNFGQQPQDDQSSPIRRQPSFKWAQYKPSKSPTKAELDTPNPSPQQLEHDVPPYTRATSQSQFPSSSNVSDKSRTQPAPSDSPSIPQVVAKPARQDSTDNLKSFKVSLEDPTWKVLPAALKKYRINNDNWENYAMFICYGTAGASSPPILVLS